MRSEIAYTELRSSNNWPKFAQLNAIITIVFKMMPAFGVPNFDLEANIFGRYPRSAVTRQIEISKT
jgi:hypothetical protein